MAKDIHSQKEDDTIPQISTDEKIRIIANLLIDQIVKNQIQADLNKSNIIKIE